MMRRLSFVIGRSASSTAAPQKRIVVVVVVAVVVPRTITISSESFVGIVGPAAVGVIGILNLSFCLNIFDILGQVITEKLFSHLSR